MTAILTADIHMTDRPQDEYRWGLFDWLAEQKADELIILGDLSDAKDRHPSRLVNRLHKATVRLEDKFRIIYLKGNHDYLDPAHPFFEFLGSSSDIVFVSDLKQIKLSIGSAFFVPAGVRWDFKLPDTDYLFTHATFSGAKAETGRMLTGVNPAVLSGFAGKVYSGDIHVPQKVGPVEYVGAPYHVRFGDSFEPRLVRIDSRGKASDLHYPAPRKQVFYIRQPEDLLEERAAEGDHVKVRCVLRRAEYDRWRDYCEKIKQIADDRGWRLFGAEPVAAEVAQREIVEDDKTATDPVEIVRTYAKQHKASKTYVEAAIKILEAL